MKQEIEYSKNLPKVLNERLCKTCGLEYEGNFCSNCGQKFITKRFTLKQSLLGIFDQVFNLEKGIVFTTKELLFRPGKTISDYLSLATVRYMHPFRYMFVLASISALVTILTGILDTTTETTEFLGIPPELDQEKIEQSKLILEQIKKYMAFIIMMSIPFYSIATKLVYFKKKYNYAEHLIINAYAYGLTIVLTLPIMLTVFLPYGVIINGSLRTTVFSLGLAWVFSKFFKENFFLSLLKVIIVSSIIILIIALLSAMVVSVYKGVFA